MILVDADAVSRSIEPLWLVERFRQAHLGGGLPVAGMTPSGTNPEDGVLVRGGWGHAKSTGV